MEGKLDVAFENMGEKWLKNISRPVQVYKINLGQGKSQGTAVLLRPDKPSIGVLSFQNMSGNPEQDYFADGIVEDIITALSRLKNLFVIAKKLDFCL